MNGLEGCSQLRYTVWDIGTVDTVRVALYVGGEVYASTTIDLLAATPTSSSARFWARIEEVRAVETTTVPPGAVSAVIPITVYVTGYAPTPVDIAVYAWGSNDWEEDDLGVYGPNEAISAAATLYYTIHTFNSPDTVTIELDTDTYFSYTAVVIVLEAVETTVTTTTTTTTTVTTTTTTTTTTTVTTTTTTPATVIAANILGAEVQNPDQPAGYGDYYITVVVTLSNEGGAADFYLDVEVPGGPENGVDVYMPPSYYTVVTVVLDHDFYIYGAGVFGVNVYLEHGGLTLDQAYAGAYTIESTSVITVTTTTGRATAEANVYGGPRWGTIWWDEFTGFWAIAEWDGHAYAPIYAATVMISAAGGIYGYYWATVTVPGMYLGNEYIWADIYYGAYTYATYYLPGGFRIPDSGWVDLWYDYDTNFDLTSYNYYVYGVVDDLGQTSVYIVAVLSISVSAPGGAVAEAYGYAVYASSGGW